MTDILLCVVVIILAGINWSLATIGEELTRMNNRRKSYDNKRINGRGFTKGK